MKRAGILICLIGPAGSGKTTCAMRLLADNPDSLRLSISATSRKPREGEEEGKSYYFLAREEFERRVQRGDFFEWEENHGNYYGTLKETVSSALEAGVDLLLDIDIRGALNFKKHFPGNTVIVFLAPPSSAVLRQRIVSRSSVSEKELTTRLDTARSEYAKVVELAAQPGMLDYFLVNDRMDDTYALLTSIFTAERSRITRIDAGQIRKYCTID